MAAPVTSAAALFTILPMRRVSLESGGPARRVSLSERSELVAARYQFEISVPNASGEPGRVELTDRHRAVELR